MTEAASQEPKESPPNCPYCTKPLKKAPKRKTKCPHCGKDIFVRYDQPLTEDQARDIDISRNFANQLAYQGFKYTESAIKRIGKNLGKYNESVSPKMIMTAFGYECLERSKKDSTRWMMVALAISSMAWSYGDRDLCFEVEKQIAILELRDHVQYFSTGEISADERCCPSCRDLNGRIYDVAQELSDPILPNRNCTGESYCRPSYSVSHSSKEASPDSAGGRMGCAILLINLMQVISR